MSRWPGQQQLLAVLAAQLTALAEGDSLTDCLNRRAFTARLDAALRQASPANPVRCA